MAPHTAKGEKGAGAGAPEKGAHAGASGKGAGAQAMEKGVCIICGELRNGIPAKPEFPIRAARWLRSAFSQPAKHTVACREHFNEALGRREKFEKMAQSYRLWAIIFFIITVCGSFLFNNASLWIAVPALLGSLFIALLPHLYFFPSFGQ